MDKGHGVEFDHPYNLLVEDSGDSSITKEGFFSKMVKATGEETADSLFNIAKEKFESSWAQDTAFPNSFKIGNKILRIVID